MPTTSIIGGTEQLSGTSPYGIYVKYAMRLHPLSIIAWTSLLLLVVTIVLWVGSYKSGKWIQWSWLAMSQEDRTIDVYWSTGRVGVAYTYYGAAAGSPDADAVIGFSANVRPGSPTDNANRTIVWDPENVILHRGGFFLGRVAIPTFYVETRVQLPFWSITILLLVIPAVKYWRWHLRGKALRENVCLICGYDLRASPQVCPECGTPTRLAD
jgi:hypothetical protein